MFDIPEIFTFFHSHTFNTVRTMFQEPELAEYIGYAFLDFHQSIYVAGEPESLKEVIYNHQMYNVLAERVDTYITQGKHLPDKNDAQYDMTRSNPYTPQLAHMVLMNIVDVIIIDLVQLLERADEFTSVHFDHISTKTLASSNAINVDLNDPVYVHLGDLVDAGVPAKVLTDICTQHGVGVDTPLERIIITRHTIV